MWIPIHTHGYSHMHTFQSSRQRTAVIGLTTCHPLIQAFTVEELLVQGSLYACMDTSPPAVDSERRSHIQGTGRTAQVGLQKLHQLGPRTESLAEQQVVGEIGEEKVQIDSARRMRRPGFRDSPGHHSPGRNRKILGTHSLACTHPQPEICFAYACLRYNICRTIRIMAIDDPAPLDRST